MYWKAKYISVNQRKLAVFFCWVLGFAWALGVSGCATIPPPRAALNLARSAPAEGADRRAYNLSVYDNVWSWIYHDYYDPHFNGVDWRAAKERHRDAAGAAKNDEELYAAINALLDELKDRHTHAYTRREFESVFSRINAIVGLRTRQIVGAPDGRRRVVEVFPGAAAAQAGVRVGWILLSADGRPPGEVLGPGKLRDGQVVHCEFLTETEEHRTLDLRAQQQVVPEYRSARDLEGGWRLLRFDGFDMPSAKWVREQLKRRPEPRGVILDLRANSGGHVFALGSILGDVFRKRVDTGKLVHRGHGTDWDRFVPQSGGARYSGPLAVLISDYTASAAEIFSQLIKDYDRGVVIGQRSAGAMLTSVFWPLPAGGKLQISIYDYRSPKGRRIEGQGVEPDIAIKEPEEPGEGEDAAVSAAVAALTARGNKGVGE